MQDKKHNNLLARIFTILVIQAFFFSNISYALADIKTREKASNLSALIRISYPDFQQMFYRAGYVLSEKDTNPRNYYTSSVMELTEKQKPSQMVAHPIAILYKKNYLMRFSLNKGKIIASDIKVSYGINPSAAKKKIETVLRFFGEAFPVKEIYIKTGGNLLQLQVDAADNKAILYVDRILFSFRKNWLRKFLRLFNHEWLHLAGEMKPGMSMEKSNLEESMVQITELLLALRQNNIDDIIEDLKDIRGFAYRSREQVLKESVQQQITLYRNLKKDNEVSDFSLDFLLKKVIGVQDDAFKIKLKQMVKERLGIDFELPIKLQLNKIDVLLFQTPGDISIRHKELPLKKDLASISEQAV